MAGFAVLMGNKTETAAFFGLLRSIQTPGMSTQIHDRLFKRLFFYRLLTRIFIYLTIGRKAYRTRKRFFENP
jgi:hypothetical protein